MGVRATEVPLAPPRSDAWKRHVGRAFLVLVVGCFLGSVVSQAVLWPSRTQEWDRTLRDAVPLVAAAVALGEFLLGCALRRRARRIRAAAIDGT